MPYPRYTSNQNQDSNSTMQNNMNPWQQGGGGGYSGNQNVANLFGMMGGDGNPMANLAKSLVASAFQNSPQSQLPTQMMPQPAMRNVGYSAGDRYMSDRRGDFGRGRNDRAPSFGRRRTRSRSRDRGSRGRRDDSRRSSGGSGFKRTRESSPVKDRPAHEIYIGNYPGRFREADVRNLFTENNVTVKDIRLKHDGQKVYAFAETISEDEIQKAVKALDSKEICGRRLRVRSSKDKSKTSGSSNDKNNKRSSSPFKRVRVPRREVKEEDVIKHLANSVSGFLDRQASADGLDEDKKEKLTSAKEAIVAFFELPEDTSSLKVSRTLEQIFLAGNRREIQNALEAEDRKIAEAKAKEEAEKKKQEEDEENDKEESGESEAKRAKTDDEEAPENEPEAGADAIEGEESALIDELGGAIENIEEQEDSNVKEDEEKLEEEVTEVEAEDTAVQAADDGAGEQPPEEEEETAEAQTDAVEVVEELEEPSIPPKIMPTRGRGRTARRARGRGRGATAS